ncbi:MAG TPA: acetyl-CoA carboxylase carboxyltransferase subunit alpha [Candidatus Acidoferrales bacterium]|nr:acetyl-CoA carboxylase carboxyltransferase subunit alpha [Candidatus Acidoferrales bacterium]
MAERGAQQQLAELERQLADLESRSQTLGADDTSVQEQIDELKSQVAALRDEVDNLQSPTWKRVELARHSQRPYTLDYVGLLFESFSEIHGDRSVGDDPAIVCGMARFHGEPVLVVGHQKGHDTKERVARNFGQPKPEGYRKALRAMQLAAKFRRPIFSFIDTPGAYPGVDAEARGQAEAIAYNLREMSRLTVPIVVTVTGEGGSGGALGIAIGDRVSMLENSFYSVISPEGCASIMWRDASKKELAAEALRITPEDLLALGIIDEIIPEPEGGAHRDYKGMAEILDAALTRSLAELRALSTKDLLARRYEKFRRMGQFFRLT